MRRNSYLLFVLLLVLMPVGCSSSSEETTNPESAKQLLKLRGYQFDQAGFFAAADADDAWAINTFLVAGMNPNTAQANGETVLMQAARRGNIAIMKALLNRGADVNAKDMNGHTALVWAADNRNTAVANTLLAAPNVDVNARTSNDAGVLAIYVARNREDVVPALLERGATVNHQDKDGDAALHGAALNGNVALLQMLLDKGADPDLRNKFGGTALMWSASYGNVGATRLLLDKGADPTIKDEDGLTAADWARKNRQTELVRLLQGLEK